MEKRKACSAYDPERAHCRNGFPQISALCWGGEAKTAPCLSEELAFHFFRETGKPHGALVNGHWDFAALKAEAS